MVNSFCDLDHYIATQTFKKKPINVNLIDKEVVVNGTVFGMLAIII